jgi:hypothetical protein
VCNNYRSTAASLRGRMAGWERMENFNPWHEGKGTMDYHGIIINVSLKDKSLFKTMEIIGRKSVLLDWLVLYKVSVRPENLDATILNLQANLVERFWFYAPHFYCHFYREDELIIVFHAQVFRVKTDPATWQEVIAYGRSLGIPAKQLDFQPCRIEDELY